MTMMDGAVVEAGVVGVLFGVGETGKSRNRKVKIEGKSLWLAGQRPASTLAATVTCKRLGERAEAAFLAKASGLGFGVAKPWGDSDRYDFIVDVGGRLWRVQVKSSHRAGKYGEYHVRMSDNSFQTYEENEIDALVCYVVPVDAWYVFPAEVFRGRRSLTLFCGSVRRLSKFEKFREGWWVFSGQKQNSSPQGARSYTGERPRSNAHPHSKFRTGRGI